MTYLEIVNDVLARLREDEVDAVSETAYSTLIGKYVNQVKRQVEDAWEWVALKNTVQATTVSGDYRYRLDGIKERFRITSVWDNTAPRQLLLKPSWWMTEQFNNAGSTGEPLYYDVSGVDETTGDYQIDLYPIPNVVRTININLYQRQDDLTNDDTETAVPSYPIMLGALYQAIVERGEDGGLMASEAHNNYKMSLGDAISIDAQRDIKGQHDWYVI